MFAYFDENLKFALTLVSILNPIGVLPIYISLTEHVSNQKIKKVATSCAIAVVITILVSLVFGHKVLSFFGISIASFTIGGGFLLFTMAFNMISAKHSSAKLSKKEAEEIGPAEIGVVPLAIPLLSGPGTISMAIIQADSFGNQYQWIGAIIVIVIIGILIKLILNYAHKIGKMVGTIGLNVMTRIMGLILLSLSIEMVVSGIKSILPIFKAS